MSEKKNKCNHKFHFIEHLILETKTRPTRGIFDFNPSILYDMGYKFVCEKCGRIKIVQTNDSDQEDISTDH